MLDEERARKIGAYIAGLVNEKFKTFKDFCSACLSRMYIGDVYSDNYKKMLKKTEIFMYRMMNGEVELDAEDLNAISSVLCVSFEEILTAGECNRTKRRKVTNRDIARSNDEKMWKEHIEYRGDVASSADIFGMTLIEYALRNKNYRLFRFLIDNKHVWFVSEKQSLNYVYNFDAGTDIGDYMSYYTNKLEQVVMTKLNFRLKLAALAIENHDYEMLKRLRAREIPSMYYISPLSAEIKLYKRYYSAELIDSIVYSDIEELISYFTAEYELTPPISRQSGVEFEELSEFLEKGFCKMQKSELKGKIPKPPKPKKEKPIKVKRSRKPKMMIDRIIEKMERGDDYVDCCDFPDDMDKHIAASSHDEEEPLYYLSDEELYGEYDEYEDEIVMFEDLPKNDISYPFVFPYINELISKLIRKKSRHADIALKSVLQHNKKTYTILIDLIKSSYEKYKDVYARHGYDKAFISENIAKAIISNISYCTKSSSVNYHQMTIKKEKDDIKAITTIVAHIGARSGNMETDRFIDSVNLYYKKIRALVNDPLSALRI